MSSRQKIPVLMYHALVKERSTLLHPVHINIDAFEQQLKWLSEHQYHSISLNQLAEQKSSDPNKKYCVLSFDDGYHSLFEFATPLLKRYGFIASLFLTTAPVGKKDFRDAPDLNDGSLPESDRPLTWQEVQEMQQQGWSIQAHSITHTNHQRLSIAELKEELTASKTLIEQQLGTTVAHYAFPFGKYNSNCLKLLRQCGYRTASTVHSGLCDQQSDPFRLPRLEINAGDDLESFSRKIQTGYSSSKEKIKGKLRDAIFSNPAVKDLGQKIIGKKIN